MSASVIKTKNGYTVRVSRGDGVESTKHYGEDRAGAVARAASINQQRLNRARAAQERVARTPTPDLQIVSRRPGR